MMLKSLSMMNIRSYAKAAIDFPAGYVLFRGDVGSGKSTILMAVEFALFGLGSLKPEALLSKKENRGEVALVFEVDGVTYEIGRTLVRKNNRAGQAPKDSYLHSGGRREPLTATDLKARVLEILNFREPAAPRATSRVYRYAVYTPQEEIKLILEGNEEVTRKAFGIDDYKTARDNAGAVSAHMKNAMDRLSALFRNLDGDRRELERVRREREDIGRAVAALAERKSGLEERKKRAEEALDDAQGRLRAFDSMRVERDAAIVSIRDKKSEIRGYLEAIDGARGDMVKIQKKSARHENIERPTKKTRGEIRAMLEKIRRNDGLALQKKTQLAERRRQAAELRRRLGDGDERAVRDAMRKLDGAMQADGLDLRNRRNVLQQKSSQMGEANGEINALSRSLDSASSLGRICEYCGSELTPAHVANLKGERQKKLDESRARLARIAAEKRETVQKIKALEGGLDRARADMAGLQTDLRDAGRASEMEREAEGLAAELDSLARRGEITPEDGFPRMGGEQPAEYVGRLQDALAEYERALEERDSLRQQASDCAARIKQFEEKYESGILSVRKQEARLDEVSGALAGAGDVEAEVGRRRAHRDGVQEELHRTDIDMSVQRERRDGATADISRLEKSVREAQENLARHGAYEDHVEWFDKFFIPSLEKIEKAFMDSLWYEFSEQYSKWYGMLVEDTSKASHIDHAFKPVVEQDGYDQDVHNMSGGEKTSVALAYRLALNSTMRHQTDTLRSNLLILDEPTDGFSRAQMEKVHDILDSMRSDQVIMVSHEATLEGYVDHVFEVTKSGGESSVVLKRSAAQ